MSYLRLIVKILSNSEKKKKERKYLHTPKCFQCFGCHCIVQYERHRFHCIISFTLILAKLFQSEQTSPYLTYLRSLLCFVFHLLNFTNIENHKKVQSHKFIAYFKLKSQEQLHFMYIVTKCERDFSGFELTQGRKYFHFLGLLRRQDKVRLDLEIWRKMGNLVYLHTFYIV